MVLALFVTADGLKATREIENLAHYQAVPAYFRRGPDSLPPEAQKRQVIQIRYYEIQDETEDFGELKNLFVYRECLK